MTARRLPLFIVVEGLDGAGKSTAARALAAELTAVELKTPGAELAPLRGEIMRSLARSPLATTLFYATAVAAASQQVTEYRAAGKPVVMDRYLLSTCAYGQVVRSSQYPAGLLDELSSCLVPADLTVYLHASRERRRERILARGYMVEEDRLSFELEVAERLHAAFGQLAEHRLTGRWLTIDTSACDVAGVVAQVMQALAGWGLLAESGGWLTGHASSSASAVVLQGGAA